ncbi:hypothetical protein HK102_013170, partial [Quaeritorhiza haematococci]
MTASTSGLVNGCVDVPGVSEDEEGWEIGMDSLAREVRARLNLEEKNQAGAAENPSNITTAPRPTQVDLELDELRDWLKPIDFDSHLKQFEREYVSGTGGWILNIIRDWLSTPTPNDEKSGTHTHS